MNIRLMHARSQPRFKRKTAYRPKVITNLFLLLLCGAPPPAAVLQRPPCHRLDPAPIRFGELRSRVAMREINFVSPLFADQRRPLEGALSPTHNQHPLGAEKFKINDIAGVRVGPRWQFLSHLGRIVLEPSKAETQYHLVCVNL